MTPNQMRAKAKKLEAEGGNQDQINMLLDRANDEEQKAYEADRKGGNYKKGGKVGMHRMPDGTMMKDSEHKKSKKPKKMTAEKVAAKAVKDHEKRMHKGMSGGGSVAKGYGMARGGRACKIS